MQLQKLQNLFAPLDVCYTPTQAGLLVALANTDDRVLERKRPCPGPCDGHWQITPDRVLCTSCTRSAVARLRRRSRKMKKQAIREQDDFYHLHNAAQQRDDVQRGLQAARRSGVAAANAFFALAP